jgi:saccharopine dehydrogenase-like NADP-dependent oxidoreductase
MGWFFMPAGPFEKMPIEPLDAAIDLGIDYVDISENRLFRNELIKRSDRIAGAGIRVMNGFSVVPGMSALFGRHLSPHFEELSSIRTFAAPDTRRHRGRAMFRTMLYGAGRRFPTLQEGSTRTPLAGHNRSGSNSLRQLAEF